MLLIKSRLLSLIAASFVPLGMTYRPPRRLQILHLSTICHWHPAPMAVIELEAKLQNSTESLDIAIMKLGELEEEIHV